MKMKWLFVCFLIATLLIGLCWVLMPLLLPPQGLSSGSYINLIHARHPHKLVDPARLVATEVDIVYVWIIAEVKARGVVMLGILAVVIGSVWIIRKTKITANK